MNPSPPLPLRLSPRGWIELSLLSVIWGASYIFVKIAVVEIPPLTIAFLRVSIAALALGAAMRALGVSAPRGVKRWRALAVMGLLNNVVAFSLFMTGQSLFPAEVAASLASILNATTPLFTVLLAHVFTRDEKLTPSRVLACVLGFFGVAVMIGPSVAGAQVDRGVVTGAALCLGTAVSYAASSIYGRRFTALGVSPMQTAFGQLCCASVFQFALSMAIDRPWTLPMPHAPAIAAVLGIALISTSFAYLLFFRILAKAGATNLQIVTFLIPATAVLISAIFFGERLGWPHAAGMALIACGLAAIDGRPLRWMRGRGLQRERA